MHFNDLLQRIVERGASDVHLHVGLPAMSRVNGKLNPVTESKITPRFTEALLDLMCDERQRAAFDAKHQVDLA